MGLSRFSSIAKPKLVLLKNIHEQIKPLIQERFKTFKQNFKHEDKVFKELVFCLLTPQSRAVNCWRAVQELEKYDLLLKGSWLEISKFLTKVRFKNKKARFIVQARKQFPELLSVVKTTKPEQARFWLVRNVKGLGFKEASHFLRNIGLGFDFAILDRHILKNLQWLGVIKTIPVLNKKQYLLVEEEFRKFSRFINIPLFDLDFVFWFKQTGFVFK
ncbi:N-glycosylase/DNA lyase [Candidatus Woesearchaeota archaeon]|nr:N-glycosylase/DNA lyase [Candidatus Woesearchaeota archaeon]